jgi:hypothetical protein
MANDLFSGLVKGLGAFMPQDDPNTKVFQMQNRVTELEEEETDLYAKIGKKVFPNIKDSGEYSELVAALTLTKQNLESARQELGQAKEAKEQQERLENERVERLTCPNCGTVNEDGIKFCQECGTKLEAPAKLFCPQCGTQYQKGTRFCGECGSQL